MQTDSILIVGTGALATFFAYRLAAAGVSVSMLGTWREGLDALRKNGVRLEGGSHYRVRATDNPAECRNARNALVLVKSWQTERAAGQLMECLAGNGLAATLQNGLGNDLILSESLGRRHVVRGITTQGAALLEPGLVRSGGDGEIVLEASPDLGDLENILRIAKLKVRIVNDAEPSIWGKLVVNAAINPLTALLRLRNGELLDNVAARALLGELAHETAAVAAALSIHLPYPDPVRAVEDVASRTAENRSSMYQDVLRGARTEVDAINGAVVRLAEREGVPSPVNRIIWSLVKALPVRGKI